MRKNILIVGYGSIGKRHARNLMGLGIRPYILTTHPDSLNAGFTSDINKIKNENIEYCIISSPTGMHLEDFRKCVTSLRALKKIIIEKPLECSYSRGEQIKDISIRHKLETVVAYNLRFINAFNIIGKFVRKQKNRIKIVEAVAGQDLREWRPHQDFRESYSACRGRGGGVDLDLSHEVDYILWIFGNRFRHRLAYRTKISSLEIDSPDVFKLFLDYKKFIIDIDLDYIRRPKERYLKIICDNGKNLYYDFVTGILKLGGRKVTLKNDLDQSYKKMLKEFLGISRLTTGKICSLDEALNVLKVLGV